MANYIKVTELVAREMGLTAIRNNTLYFCRFYIV